MATKEWLWVPVKVKGGIFGYSLLNKTFSEFESLAYKPSLTSLSEFWKLTKSQALTFPMGEIRHLEKKSKLPSLHQQQLFFGKSRHLYLFKSVENRLYNFFPDETDIWVTI